MKKIISLFISFLLCLYLCSCTPLSPSNTISYNEDHSEMYYNERTYINYNNTTGKYRFNREEDDTWHEIATMPYSSLSYYILDAVTFYYGNNIENPDFIICSRTSDFYVREDITLNHDTELSLCDTKEPYCFKISDAITENFIEFNLEQKNQFTKLCDFSAFIEKYPYIKLWISIYEYNDKLYLQETWDCDYYEITDNFKSELHRLGLSDFDYYPKTNDKVVSKSNTVSKNLLPLPSETTEFSFLGGSGGWKTVIALKADGTFTGNYLDSEMGDIGAENPNGSAYICSFSGKFTNIEKTDNYSYKMKLENIKTEKETGEIWVEDGIKYIASEPYGLEKGTDFIFYLPDTPIDSLPENFLSWWPYRYPSSQNETLKTLSCYGILNVDTEYGFFGDYS